MRYGWVRVVLVTLIWTLVTLFGTPVKEEQVPQVDAFSAATFQLGSSGSDVRELQGRLSYLGYYKGKVDAQFGWGTHLGLKAFQKAFGMTADGVAGPKTKLKLWQASKNWRPGATETTVKATAATNQNTGSKILNSTNISANDLKLLARVIYGEARGEPYEGMVAVAAVVLNRIENPLFPDSVSGVVFQPGAFTAVADGQIWLEPDKTSQQAALDALSGWDPSGQAMYYFNPKTATSKWIWSRPQIKQIGEHIFTK